MTRRLCVTLNAKYNLCELGTIIYRIIYMYYSLNANESRLKQPIQNYLYVVQICVLITKPYVLDRKVPAQTRLSVVNINALVTMVGYSFFVLRDPCRTLLLIIFNNRNPSILAHFSFRRLLLLEILKLMVHECRIICTKKKLRFSGFQSRITDNCVH